MTSTNGNPRGAAGARGIRSVNRNACSVTQTLPSDQRATFQLTLRAEPNCVDPTRELRRLLKHALRYYRLRCTDYREVQS
jgi:hypothetical protein